MRISGITYIPRRTHGLKKFILILLILILISVISIVFVSGFTAWKITHPERDVLKPFSSNIVPEYKDVKFLSRDKRISLSGWFFEKKGSDKTVIIGHDYGKNRLQFGEQTIDMVKVLLNNGYNVLCFDFRNSGKSEGSVNSICLLEKEDLLGAVKFAKGSTNSKHVVLMGFSTAASTSILAAAESTDIDVVIADSPFADYRNYMNKRLMPWKLPSFPFDTTVSLFIRLFTGTNNYEIDIEKASGDISPRPVLFIYGSDDEIIKDGEIRQLNSIYTRASGSMSEIFECDGAKHLEAYTSNPKAYIDKVLEFLGKTYNK